MVTRIGEKKARELALKFKGFEDKYKETLNKRLEELTEKEIDNFGELISALFEEEQDFFEGAIDLTFKEGEQQAKKEIKEYYENLIKKIELDFFVMSYAHCVPKKQRDKTSKQVRELREEEWNKALKEAKGDIDKAHDILWDNIMKLTRR